MYIDIHAHMYKYPYPVAYDKKSDKYTLMFPNGEQLIKLHDELKIDRAVIVPLVSSEVYVPQSVGEVIEFANNSNGRFIPFCSLDPRVLENKSDTDLGFIIEYYKKQGCKGMGEVLPNLPFFDPKMQNLYYHCEKAKFPLLFDISGNYNEGYGIYDDVNLPQLRSSLEKFPDLIFIGHGPAFWAELDLIKPNENRVCWSCSPMKGEGVVAKYLRDYKNLWIDLSAASGYYAMTRDIEYTKKFMNEFSDRIMFGTDICYAEKPRTILIDLIEQFRKDGVLSEEKYQAITHKNAERLLGL